jgi:hypothetical protein
MNYFSTDGITPRIAWCAVCDPATGEVVHIHEFIGNEIADDNPHAQAMRAEAALAHVQRTRKRAKGLDVVHGDPKKRPNVGDRFQYDVRKKKLITTHDRVSLREVEKAATAAEVRTPGADPVEKPPRGGRVKKPR